MLAGWAAPVQIRNADAACANTAGIAVVAILAAIGHAVRIRAGLAGWAITAFTATIVVFDTVAGIRISMVANQALRTTEPVAAAFITRPTTLSADGAAVACLFLGRFVRVSSRRGLRHRRVVQVGIGRTRRAHIPGEPAATRVRRRTGGRHIRQEVAIAGALYGIARVVADIVVVAGLSEVDIAVGADPVGDDMADEALRRAAAIELRHMTGMGNAVGAEVKIGNRMDRLNATNLATLRGGIIWHAIAGGRSQHHPRRANAGCRQHAAKGRAQQPFQHRSPGCSLAERTREVVEASFFHVLPGLGRHLHVEHTP